MLVPQLLPEPMVRERPVFFFLVSFLHMVLQASLSCSFSRFEAEYVNILPSEMGFYFLKYVITDTLNS